MEGLRGRTDGGNAVVVEPARAEASCAGPGTLWDALAACEPGPAGLRAALSTPGGDFLAVQVGRQVHVRRVAGQSGHAGSILGTGGWLKAEEVPGVIAWRPA